MIKINQKTIEYKAKTAVGVQTISDFQRNFGKTTKG